MQIFVCGNLQMSILYKLIIHEYLFTWWEIFVVLLQVWDREIILTTLKEYYENDVDLLLEAIEGNYTDVRLPIFSTVTWFLNLNNPKMNKLKSGTSNFLVRWLLPCSYMHVYLHSAQGIWSDDVASWNRCNDLSNCVNRWVLSSLLCFLLNIQISLCLPVDYSNSSHWICLFWNVQTVGLKRAYKWLANGVTKGLKLIPP